MDVPMDYHVWNTMLGHYQRHMTKLANIMLRWKTVLSTIQGRCYGNQLNLEDGRRHRQEWPLLLVSAFDSGLADR